MRLDGVVESQTSRQRSAGNLAPSTLLGMFKLVFETGHVHLKGLERPPHVLAYSEATIIRDLLSECDVLVGRSCVLWA